MGRRGWIALLLLAPFGLIAVGLQIATATGLVGAAQLAWAMGTRSTADLERGIATIQRAADIVDLTWSSPAAIVVEYNPMTLGAVDDLRTSAHALAVASRTLDPLGQIGAAVVGFDGSPPLIAGTTVDLSALPTLAEPIAAAHADLVETRAALSRIPGSGLLGRPIGAVADSLDGTVADLATLASAVDTAMPALPEALGARGTRRYLLCALNDAELFGSGGAPLSAMVIQAARGTISVPISGQLESKLSPNNPPIVWEHAGGPPWYRAKRYPFVNSNFHPDFRTASVDMERAWASLGYPEVDGVITVDLSALAMILDWTGPVDSPGFGTVSGATLIDTVLVDAYRQFDSPEGVLERHARNEALTTALMAHLKQPMNLVPAVRGAMAAIPPRHIQAAFDESSLQRAVGVVGATGALSEAAGDLVGVYSQSGPNKLSVFQERTITHEVRLTPDGGADVARTVSFHNAVPAGLAGDSESYRGYLALRARMRVAHRLPLGAWDMAISTGSSSSLVPIGRTGPFPDERGGQVLWQGHEAAPRATTTVTMRYRLPAGTFRPGSYEVSCDPQALAIPAQLRLRVIPAPGVPIAAPEGWGRADGALVWSGALDRSLHLVAG